MDTFKIYLEPTGIADVLGLEAIGYLLWAIYYMMMPITHMGTTKEEYLVREKWGVLCGSVKLKESFKCLKMSSTQFYVYKSGIQWQEEY